MLAGLEPRIGLQEHLLGKKEGLVDWAGVKSESQDRETRFKGQTKNYKRTGIKIRSPMKTGS